MLTRRTLVMTAATAALARPAVAQQRSLPNLPTTQVWSVYDVGTSGYVEASAIADALGRAFGTRVRLQPSGTSIGRVLPLKQKRASHAWLGNELNFAAEGLYEYAAPDWGPQDFRVLAGRKNSLAFVATKESGITKPEDVKGKRLAWVPANTSVNVKAEPLLAFAGLTMNDVEVVQFPSYVASLRALIDGRADFAGAAPAAPVLRELEASPRGISWVQLDPNNTAAWAVLQHRLPFVEPFSETIGAGISEQNPANLMGYRYPMIAVNADATEVEIYALMKAVADTFDLFKDSNPIMPRWAMRNAGTPPMDVPFHDGAIRYLQEAGIWTPAYQQWQDRALARLQVLTASWREFLPRSSKLPETDFAKAWGEYRTAALSTLKG
jgi:uncharacterized protein